MRQQPTDGSRSTFRHSPSLDSDICASRLLPGDAIRVQLQLEPKNDPRAYVCHLLPYTFSLCGISKTQKQAREHA